VAVTGHRRIDVETRRRNCAEMTLDLKVEIDVECRRRSNVVFNEILIDGLTQFSF